jgi:hypothetical protein
MSRVVRGGAGRAVLPVVVLLAAATGLAYWRYCPASAKPAAGYAVAATVTQTDNSACLVCHSDFETEELVVKHLKGGIVCASCHGESEIHRSDELNVTPPEVLFGGSEIGPFCKGCHPAHKDQGKYDAFLKEWNGRRRPNARLITADSLCTDCHGNHVILPPSKQNGG